MRFVPVKSVEQQDIQAAHRLRAILLRHRTALIDQMRDLLGERGFAISRSPEEFKRPVPELLRASADELTSFCRTLLTELLVHLRAIKERIHFIEISIHSFMKRSALCGKIAQYPASVRLARRPSLQQWATPDSSAMAGIWLAGWAWCRGSIPPAAGRGCITSAGAVTPTCARCSFMARERCCGS
jgi:transposase